MAAIKAFFARNRASKMRSATVVPIEEPEVVVVKNPFQEDIYHYETVLERDWFLDYESLMEFIFDASPEVFQHIYANRQKYPDRVQRAFNDVMRVAYHYAKPTKPTVKDLSDEDMFDIEQDSENVSRQEFEDAWKNYKIAKGISRGVSKEEECLHVFDMMLRREKDALADYRKKAKRVYVPPSRKNAEPPKPDANEMKMLTKIENLENETKNLQKRIAELDNLWEETQKDEFAKQYYKMW